MNGNSFSKSTNIFERNPNLSIVIIVACIIILLDISLTKIHKIILNYGWSEKKEIVQKHKTYHHTFKKLKKARLYNHNIFTNSLGFKDNSNRKISLRTDNHRILFMGDSFTEGIYQDYGNTFVGIIDSAFSLDSLEVLNGGRAGYSPIIYWKKTEFFIDSVGLMFDELIVFLDWSDWKEEIKVYTLSDDSLSVIGKYQQKNQSPQPTKVTIQTVKKIIYKNTTVIYYFLNLLYDNLGLKKDKMTNKSLTPKVPWEMFFQEWEEQILLDYSVDKEFINGCRLMKKRMNNLLLLAKNNKINLSIAIYPTAGQTYGIPHNIWVEIWEEWSRKNNLKMYNFFATFNQIKKEKNLSSYDALRRFYFTNDIHFNKMGNRVIANSFIDQYHN